MIRNSIKQGKPSLEQQASEIRDLITEVENRADALSVEIAKDVNAPDFDKKLSKLNELRSRIVILQEKEMRILNKPIDKEDLPDYSIVNVSISRT